MWTFDRYILNQVFPTLGATLLVALLILLVERMLRVFNLVLGNSGALHYVARMLVYLSPHYLSLALPLAFFLAILLTFNRMTRESEFDAFMAAGIGLHQLVRPLLLVTGLILLIAAITTNYLQPHARYAYRALVSAVKSPLLYTLAKEGVFVSNGEMTFLVEDISPDRETYRGVFIYEDNTEGQTAVTTAKRGVLDQQPAGSPSYAHLFDGVRLSVPRQEDAAGASVIDFSELRISLGDGDFGPFRPRGRDEREFTLLELWHLRNNPSEGVRNAFLIAEFHSRLVRLLSIIGLPFMAVSLAVGKRRSTRFYGIAVGAGILFLYHELLQMGDRLVGRALAEPWLALWLPLLGFLVLSGLMFYRTAFLPGETRPLALLDHFSERCTALLRGLRTRGRK